VPLDNKLLLSKILLLRNLIRLKTRQLQLLPYVIFTHFLKAIGQQVVLLLIELTKKHTSLLVHSSLCLRVLELSEIKLH
jgi:hypothetical protein